MDKQQRKYVVVFSVLVIGYFVILGFGVFGGKDDDVSKTSPPVPDWVPLVNKVTSFFAPRLDLDKVKCDGKAVSHRLPLDNQFGECSIDLSPGMLGEKDFWKVSLRLYRPRPSLYLEVQYSGDEEKPESCLENIPASGLVVIFQKKDNVNLANRCWLLKEAKKDLDFVVQDPSLITLNCIDCKNENGVVYFKLE